MTSLPPIRRYPQSDDDEPVEESPYGVFWKPSGRAIVFAQFVPCPHCHAVNAARAEDGTRWPYGREIAVKQQAVVCRVCGEGYDIQWSR